MNDRQYIAFISYRHRPLDSAVAQKLHSLIEQYRIPRLLRKDGQKRLGYVFRDQEELPISSNLSQSIRDALDRSDYLIVVCSPETRESQWVQAEADYFLQHHDNDHLFAVLAEGEPKDAFLPSMTQMTREDGTVEFIEPLAVDARAGSIRRSLRKLRMDKLRLIAALINCPYDALAARETHRRARRAFSVAAAVIAIALAFSMLVLRNNWQISRMNGLLSERNAELQQQKAETQLRESKLLTASAQAALDRKDMASAIRFAAEALPRDEKDDRPYYPQAESALMSAMNLFEPDAPPYLIADTVLEQPTAIVDYLLSGDGNRAVTIDGYGMLYCYDAHTGDVLWHAQMVSDMEDTVYIRPADTRVFYIDDAQAVIGVYHNTLTAYSAETGVLLWTAHAPMDDANAVFLSPNRSMIALVTRTDKNHYFALDTRYDLMFLSTATGEILESFLLLDSVNFFDYSFYSSYSRNIGSFSEDGRYFAGLYLDRHGWEDGNEEQTLVYYIADLEQHTLTLIEDPHQEVRGETTNLILQQESNILICIANATQGSSVSRVCGYDLTTGELQWETIAPDGRANAYRSQFVNRVTTVSNNTLYISEMDRLFALDIQSGELVLDEEMPDEVICMYAIDDTFWGCVHADGSYVVARHSSDGISLSDALPLGAVSRVEVGGIGWMKGYVGDDGLTGFTYGDELDGYGSLAVIETEDDNKVAVKRIRHARDTLETYTLLSQETMAFSLSHASEDTIVLPGSDGLLYARVDTDTVSKPFVFNMPALIAIDPLTHETRIVAEPDRGTLWLLPDASGYLIAGTLGFTHYRLSCDNDAPVTESDPVRQFEMVSNFFIPAGTVLAFTRSPADNAVLTVHCDGTRLLLWRNGEDEQMVPIPENIRWELSIKETTKRYLDVGGNGYVIMSHFAADTTTDSLDSFALYNTQTGDWSMFEDQTHGSTTDRRICTGAVSPVFAVADNDQTLRVYDIAAGRVTAEIPLTIPSNAVTQVQFLLDDSLIILRMSDGRFFLYDVSESRLVYSTDQPLAPNMDATVVNAWRDTANQRLYLNVWSSHVGYCIDEHSGEMLAEISGMLCYVPETNEVYQYTDDAGLVAVKVPSTLELVETGLRLTER